MSEVLRALDAIIAERRTAADPGASYVAALMHKGLDAILKKVAEEGGETLIAAKDAQHGGDPGAVVRETADLWFHCLVMLGALGLDSAAVLAELERRFGLSGLEEKAARSAAPPAARAAD